jgi:hypothetical protein
VADFWRTTALTLAGPDAELHEDIPPQFNEQAFAIELAMPGAYFRREGADPEDAFRSLAHAIAGVRLLESLEAAGWTDIDEVIDETTYVVARDPSGTTWAIGVASSDGMRRHYLEPDMERDGRAERIAFVEPVDTASPSALLGALSTDRPT